MIEIFIFQSNFSYLFLKHSTEDKIKEYTSSDYYSKDKLENTLFIGNGLNRCLQHGFDWANLLKSIADNWQIDYYENDEMPMEFERIINEYLQKFGINSILDASSYAKKNDVYLDAKMKIAEKINSIEYEHNCILKDLPINSIQNIITTNYDRLLEEAIGTEKNFPFPGNTKYLRTKTSTFKDGSISLFHAHGIIDKPNTICLGYEHYMGVVEHLRHNLNSVDTKTKNMHIYDILTGKAPTENTWAEKFYTSNIAMIGFGLPSCEADIWWLLTHRAYLYNTNYNGIRDYLINSIVYYDIVPKKDSKQNVVQNDTLKKLDKTAYKHHLLKNLHVVVKPIYIENDSSTYEEKYRKIFKEIEEGLCWPTSSYDEANT